MAKSDPGSKKAGTGKILFGGLNHYRIFAIINKGRIKYAFYFDFIHRKITIMATNKKESFSETEQGLANVAKALSHPARIAILHLLAKRNECICGEIVDELPLAQSTVSQHLKELKNAGLISGTIDGPKSCYCINWEKIDAIAGDLSGLFMQLKERNRNCC